MATAGDNPPRPLGSILSEVAVVADEVVPPGPVGGPRYRNIDDARKKRQQARRMEALALKLAGVGTEQIAERLGISADGVRDLINRTLARAENQAAEEMRAIENARLDRAQAAIWQLVLAGDYRAVMTFLGISARRARLNGLDAPAAVTISASVRTEMEQALAELAEVVAVQEAEQAEAEVSEFGRIVEAEVDPDPEPDDD